jgi:hypothetical protein
MTEFGSLHPDGTYELKGHIKQSDMLKCPHCIIAFEHYRPDGSCRCNDENHKEMKEWGYKWSKSEQRWK